MRIYKFAMAIVIGLSFTQCKSNSAGSKPDVLASHLDTTVSPQEDFFAYANGGWIKNNPIPGELSNWGIGNLVIEENLKRLREICEKSKAAGGKDGSSEQQIGDYWAAAMDSAKIDADGLKPLQPWLTKIDAVTDVKSLVSTVSELKKIGSSTLFSDYASQDEKNSEVMAYHLSQGGLGLPEREYYFKTDSATVAIRTAYVNHISKMLQLAGTDTASAQKAGANILALETQLAKASRKLEDLRDPYRNYNKIAIADLGKLNGSFDWSNYLNQTGVTHVDSVIVGQPEFFNALDVVLKKTAIADWKAYLRYNLLQDFSAALPDKFGIEAFEFNKQFSGAKERRPRWKRVIAAEESAMGELLGKLYVKEFFSETAKKRYDNMVEDIRAALKDRIGQLSWMSDSTKKKAYTKLASIKKKVGYPDKWKDFSSSKITKDSWVANLASANQWWHQYELNKLGKPVDRDEWDMFPQTYNAYYNPSNNEIVLPAGIFTVPGYRDEELDDATVYGYAGASTIGHEITHGFDDEGRQFDEKGNLLSWWTKKDEEEFNKRAQLIINQFNEFEPLPGYHINGKATTGENIADLGGILLGIQAYKKTKEYQEGKSVAGLTPMQRYFLGYSLGWMEHPRDETLRNRLLTDVHSPAKYRVNGPFVNVEEFYTAFGVKPVNKMYRADSLRVKIW